MSGMITSAHNLKILLARTLLGRAKERREKGAFVAEGVRLVEEALVAKWPFRYVLAAETLSDRGNILVSNLQDRGVDVETVADTLVKHIGETETSQGLFAILDHFQLPVS